MAGNSIRSDASEPRRWDSALEPLLGARTEGLWRLHSDAVNATLLAGWLPLQPCANLLKTDSFDEAMGDGLYQLLSARAERVAGLDVASSDQTAAVARPSATLACAADGGSRG